MLQSGQKSRTSVLRSRLSLIRYSGVNARS